jgi:hypothetical protein
VIGSFTLYIYFPQQSSSSITTITHHTIDGIRILLKNKNKSLNMLFLAAANSSALFLLLAMMIMILQLWCGGGGGAVSGFVVVVVARNRNRSCRHPQQKFHDHPMIGTGFSFDDGEQLLVSVQKPLGIVLEQQQQQQQQQNDDDDDNDGIIVRVTDVDPSGSAHRAGVRIGDVLVAVQNASVEQVDLESVLEFIQKGPRVMNLRLKRQE